MAVGHRPLGKTPRTSHSERLLHIMKYTMEFYTDKFDPACGCYTEKEGSFKDMFNDIMSAAVDEGGKVVANVIIPFDPDREEDLSYRVIKHDNGRVFVRTANVFHRVDNMA